MKKMIRALLAFATVGFAILCARLVHSQTAACGNNANCITGFYCDRETFHCTECLKCEDLNREPPRSDTPCIMSFAECGPCTKGLVENHSGAVNFVCVPPDTGTGDNGLPIYVWVAMVVGFILFVIILVIVYIVLRRTDTFKVLASTCTSVQSPCSRNNASAPELPPPYDATANAPYNPYIAAPSPPQYPDATIREEVIESSRPFIKRAPSEMGEGAGEREAAGFQAARVFNYPRYVRAPLSSYKIPTMNVDEETESTFTVYDEDTMESTWTPVPSADHTDTNDNGPLSPLAPAPLHAPNSSIATHAPHAPLDNHAPHALCSLQDTNNNCNSGESNVSGTTGAAGASSAAGASGTPTFIINVVQNINAVQQHNDVTL